MLGVTPNQHAHQDKGGKNPDQEKKENAPRGIDGDMQVSIAVKSEAAACREAEQRKQAK